MFAEEEIEALALGIRWVADRADGALGAAAQNALAKIAAVLPPDLRDRMDASALLVGPGEPIVGDGVDLAVVRRAIRGERKLSIAYCDRDGAASERIVWPFALGFFDRLRVMVAWCELRGAIRHFRADRIVSVTALEARYPRRRQALLKEWREAEGIPAR
ncbi:helix-turn-helix transcriptional regulator [Azospirillum brasilense]|uniref:helix-turn-helix transcriptional regulator n=1 Tax=Azospirillum brasilense TaxID=192 RepID=UPI001FFFC6E8|nr:WYL domain-containing protein [Azospirillum brasilense]